MGRSLASLYAESRIPRELRRVPYPTFTYDRSDIVQTVPVKKRRDRETKEKEREERGGGGGGERRSGPRPAHAQTSAARPRAFKLFVSLRVDELHT